MIVLRLLTDMLLFPGNLVLNKLGVSIEEDGGILRSFINSTVWGGIALIIALKIAG